MSCRVLRYEKAKGADVARKLHAERGAKGTITLIDDFPEVRRARVGRACHVAP